MPDTPLQEVAALVASSRSLRSLALSGCELKGAAGVSLAEGLALSTRLGLPLANLELHNNRLDSQIGKMLALALQGNCRRLQLCREPNGRRGARGAQEGQGGGD